MSNVPRRSDMLRWVPAEVAIRRALIAVEEMPADVRLTRAVLLLIDAQRAVADYVDGEPGTPLPSEARASGETEPLDVCGGRMEPESEEDPRPGDST